MARVSAFAGIVLAAAAAWLYLMPPASLHQPIAFDHAKHRPTACAVCHRGAESEARAGIPQRELCLECHAAPPRTASPVLWAASAPGTSIPWLRVARVPDHVFFSHRRHTALAGLECSSCHADVGQSTAPPGRARVRLDMNACLDCHRREGASEDCAACHR